MHNFHMKGFTILNFSSMRVDYFSLYIWSIFDGVVSYAFYIII